MRSVVDINQAFMEVYRSHHGANHTPEWEQIWMQVRARALEVMTTEKESFASPEEKLAYLRRAREMPLFSEHLTKTGPLSFARNIGRTGPAVTIDNWIAEVQAAAPRPI